MNPQDPNDHSPSPSPDDRLQTLPAMFVCPYCGAPTPDQPRCASCRGFLDPLSRQASQNAMGPWSIRNAEAPFHAGCSYETLMVLLRRGRVTVDSVLKGPTTHQFWSPAKRVPGVAHLLGLCHNCGCDVDGDEHECPECHAEFSHHPDRQVLGLMPVRAVPGQPVVAAAEGANAVDRGPSTSAEPSAALLRHVEALESQNKWVWSLAVTLLAVTAVGAAVVGAAFLSGAVRVDPTWGAAPAAGPTNPPAAPPAPSQPSPTTPAPPRAPDGDAAPEAEPATALPEGSTPADARPTPESPEIGGESRGELERLRALVGQDTEESLREAIRRLEELGAGAGKKPGFDGLLATAKGRLAQKQLRGVR